MRIHQFEKTFLKHPFFYFPCSNWFCYVANARLIEAQRIIRSLAAFGVGPSSLHLLDTSLSWGTTVTSLNWGIACG